MVPKPDRDRIKALLTEAITVLCKNGLSYEYTCGIQGLLGLTLDDQDVFLVDLRESIIKKERPVEESIGEEASDLEKTLSELPEPEPHTQPSSPRSGASRRKRRRQSGQSSPTKRTAYSEDVDPGDEVIVIKEELFDTGACQGYGDIGEGGEMHQQDSNSSYPIASSGDYAGGECSQWGTASPSSSSHSAWPSLTQQQQQQQDMYPMPSSSFTPPTQQSRYKSMKSLFPNKRLTNSAVLSLLTHRFIIPVMTPQHKVTAMRISWLRLTEDMQENVWKNILPWRDDLDRIIRQVPGVRYFISALTATQSTYSQQGQPPRYGINPGVGYWVVSDSAVFDERNMLTLLQRNPYRASVKPLIITNPNNSQITQQQLFLALTSVVKDNVDGVVLREVQSYATGTVTLVRVVVLEEEEKQGLEEAVSVLEPHQFPMTLV